LQASEVASKLEELGYEVELVAMDTTGDRQLAQPLHRIGEKGLFTAELEAALDRGEVDMAVHSLKDLETTTHIPVHPVGVREQPWDCLIVSHQHRRRGLRSLAELPSGSVIGTSSLRRMAQIATYRQDLKLADLRGNVETRLTKIQAGRAGLDAGVMAWAGLLRSGLEAACDQVISPGICLPAAGQGVLAVQVSPQRKDLGGLVKILQTDPGTVQAATAEREALAAIEGGCRTPFGAYAKMEGESSWSLEAFIATPDCRAWQRDRVEGPANDLGRLARQLGAKLKAWNS
jgi:hydroxymethylbilane synthase